MSSVISSYEAQFKTTGVQEVKNGFAEIAKAAALADRQSKVDAQNLRDYAKSKVQTENEIARATKRSAAEQAKAAMTMFPAFEKAKTSVAQWATANAGLLSTVGAVAGVVYGAGKAAAASYMEFQNYAGSVRDLSSISGTGAEQTSRFIQVLDDFQLSAEDVTVATKAMTKQGLAPTVETLAKLSDQYKAIQDPMERNAFVLKNLGKGGLNWVNALNQGGAALLKMGGEVEQNLILTDKQIATSEKSRLAIDALTDKWDGFKVKIGSAVGEMIVAVDEGKNLREQFVDLGLKTETVGNRMGHTDAAFERFRRTMEKGAAMTDFYSKMQENLKGKNEEVQQTEEERAAIADRALSGGLKLTEMQSAMTNKSTELNAALVEQTNILNNLREQGYVETSSKIQNQIATVNKLKGAIVANNTAQVKSYSEYALSILKVKGATTEQQLAFSVASGQITQGAANQQMAQEKVADAFMSGQITAQTYASEIGALMKKIATLDGKKAVTYIDVFIREHTTSAQLATITQEKLKETGGAQGQHGGEVGDFANPKASGGMLSRGWNLVGDAPGGGFIPGVSELIHNGRVYSSKESQRLIESGKVSLMKSYALPNEDVYTTPIKSLPPPNSTGNYVTKTKNKGGDVLMPTSSGTQIVVKQAAEMQVQTQSIASQAQSQIQNMVTQLQASQQAAQSVFEEMLSVLRNENPRAIGKQVAFEFSKMT